MPQTNANSRIKRVGKLKIAYHEHRRIQFICFFKYIIPPHLKNINNINPKKIIKLQLKVFYFSLKYGMII